MAGLFPDNSPAQRIFHRLTGGAPHLRERLVLNPDAETRAGLEAAAARYDLSPRLLAHQWLAEKAEEYQTQIQLEETWAQLTPKEQAIVGRYCAEYEEQEIAEAEGIQPATVRQHLHRSMKKFGVHKRERLRHLLSAWDFSSFDKAV